MSFFAVLGLVVALVFVGSLIWFVWAVEHAEEVGPDHPDFDR